MTDSVATLDSPPNLTYSKTSKASSLNSSSLSGQDGIISDISHFEEIGLDDELSQSHHHVSQSPYPSFATNFDRHSLPKRPPPRAGIAGSRNSTPNMGPPRELTTQRRPQYPSLRGQVNGALREGPGFPRSAPATRRGFTSPSAPSLPIATTRRRSSRSPSPLTPSSCPISPRSVTGAAPKPRQGLSPGVRCSSRRSSWQPQRRTTAELEAECNDSDDDIPDDAVFWNIPISPRPPHERSLSTSAASGYPSTDTSPERRSPTAQSRRNSLSSSSAVPPMPLDSSTSLPNIHEDLPLSPWKSKLPHEPSTGASQILDVEPSMRKTRARSWNTALSSLSDEAKSLTEALEVYAENEERQQEDRVQNGSSRLTFRPELKVSKKRINMMELPPLNKGNIMIDPLPISKEKEAVLTRTRPSWLPPKSKREEKKHLKEYQQMMALAQEAEIKRAHRQNLESAARETVQTSLHRIWDTYILPNWQAVISEPKTRELWWRGISPHARGVVWQRAIGNELELTEMSYIAALRRAKEAEADLSKHGARSDKKRQKQLDGFRAIRRDVQDAFPELRIFQSGGPLNDGLVDVLLAYSMYRSDVGYVYGTHLMAALLCLNLDPPKAFVTLANLLNRPIPMAFLTCDSNTIANTYNIVWRTLAYKLPRLNDHLRLLCEEGQLREGDFPSPMISTLFTRNLDVDHISRLWDVYVFEGDAFLIRCVVAILDKLEPNLYCSGSEIREVIGWEAKTWDVGGEDDFMRDIRSAGKVDKGLDGPPPVVDIKVRQKSNTSPMPIKA